jgi:crotonobetainyl-CoA:carnitine CoA-transferase CaiB-like acyl-CoA transferase
MAEWCRSRSSDAVLAELDAAGVPAAPVLSPQQALEHPQIAASGYLRPAGAADAAGATMEPPITVAPFDLGAASAMRGPAPKLGEHTDSILQTLGYTGAEIAELRRQRVV